MPDYKYWNAFKFFSGFNFIFFKKIINYFPSLEIAYNASFLELRKAGLKEETIEKFLETRKEIEPVREWEKLEKEGISLITIEDKDYPALLKEIYDPPVVIYYKGILKKDGEKIGVVGTRKCTSYGLQATEKITGELVENGMEIVSGLALGIDTIAHSSALEKNGCTIAVLGSGIDEKTVYPPQNRDLAKKIIEKGGALISEYPCATPPLKQNFPLRNRIISGLSLGTLVIEAPYESGALITARCALEHNREVFAIPGNIYNRNSEGTNNLIKLGAHPVTSGKDILEALCLKQIIAPKDKKIIPRNKEEKILLNFLSKEPIHIDKLVELSKLKTAIVTSSLALMEIENKVKNLGGMNYVIN
ncbi:MAG: hypothetical protein Athens101410_603 [Parcubacteria group bacterium Athens1014_10]|nr:MAG: hypothetical protein Athens101410_603 [Parcubacteria group bacterium Athens1014_10]TSD06126.1 MAG: hypothetical protein Athens071412_100 [Parcubacteria group bacterium Athens0714_12]